MSNYGFFVLKVRPAVFAAVLVLSTAAPLCAGGQSEASDENGADRPVVTTTFTIIEDFASRVAGEEAEVRNLTPAGAEVHEYELRPQDFVNLEEADIVFYNGFDIEQWIRQVREVASGNAKIVPVAERADVSTISIQMGEYEGRPDPHLWMDPGRAIGYVEVIRDELSDLDPESADAYERNAAEYIAELEQLEDELHETLSVIPENRRILITSEEAFLYFASAFDFEHQGIWGTNHEDEGTPEQLARVIDLVRERRPPAVFWESTISDRHVRSVASDTGVRVAGPLYVDSISASDPEVSDYASLLRANVRLLVEEFGR
ncbi:MAG: metal ABC transporter solute-binding protein, Zn/Mn family [Spirochaetia bacterium]